MLMQTAFHVSGAGTFYQQKDVDEEKLPDSKGFSQDVTDLWLSLIWIFEYALTCKRVVFTLMSPGLR